MKGQDVSTQYSIRHYTSPTPEKEKKEKKNDVVSMDQYARFRSRTTGSQL